MTQKRVNNVMLCNVHKEHLAGVDAVFLANLFINESTETRRKRTFGAEIKYP